MPSPSVSGGRWGGGQSASVPSQTSATSHEPAAPRQSVPAGRTRSVGQSSELPSHTSVRSQSPAGGRHTVPAGAADGDVRSQAPAPSHVPRVQVPRAPGHATPAASNWQVAEQQSPGCTFPSSHCSPPPTTPSPQPRRVPVKVVETVSQPLGPRRETLALPLMPCCSGVTVPKKVETPQVSLKVIWNAPVAGSMKPDPGEKGGRWIVRTSPCWTTDMKKPPNGSSTSQSPVMSKSARATPAETSPKVRTIADHPRARRNRSVMAPPCPAAAMPRTDRQENSLDVGTRAVAALRSEEHTSELQSLRH